MNESPFSPRHTGPQRLGMRRGTATFGAPLPAAFANQRYTMRGNAAIRGQGHFPRPAALWGRIGGIWRFHWTYGNDIYRPSPSSAFAEARRSITREGIK